MIVADLGPRRAVTRPAGSLGPWGCCVSSCSLRSHSSSAVLSVFFDIASQSLLPMILRDERLAEGNARLFTGWSIAEIAGPGAAGWLVQAITAPFAILVDAISYIMSAVMLFGMRPDEHEVSLAYRGRNAAGFPG